MSVSGILNAVHVRPCRLLLQYQQQLLTVTGNAWVIMGGDEVQRPALAESLAKRDRWLFHRLPTSLYRRREKRLRDTSRHTYDHDIRHTIQDTHDTTSTLLSRYTYSSSSLSTFQTLSTPCSAAPRQPIPPSVTPHLPCYSAPAHPGLHSTYNNVP